MINNNMTNQDHCIAYWTNLANEVLDLSVSVKQMIDYQKMGAKLTELDEIGYHYSMSCVDFVGNRCFTVLSMFIKPEHRGLHNLERLMKSIEVEAKKHGCTSILVSGSVDFKDSSFNKYLARKGYKQSVMKKEI